MDDERWEPGMPVLDRQAVREAAPASSAGSSAGSPIVGGSPAASMAGSTAGSTASSTALAGSPGRGGARPVPGPLPPSLAGLPPRSVPETKPTRLQQQYVLMSVPGLIAGFIAITALELGMPLSSPLIKLCVLIGAPLLVVANADAIVRIWRAAWAWMPVDRTKGLFRLAWVAVAGVSWLLLIALALLVLFA
jgi:hypothetical protein